MVLTTQNKKDEVMRLFHSLQAQYDKNFYFEIVFIDQFAIFETHEIAAFNDNFSNIYIKHIPYKDCSLSHARNIGLQNVEKNYDFIMFPDDDCWFPSDFFGFFSGIFTKYSFDIICTSVFDPFKKKSYGSRPLDVEIPINYMNVFKYPISVGIIISSNVNFDYLVFDERFGCGSPYGSGEETLLLVDLIKHNYKCVYNGFLRCFHELPNSSFTNKKHFDYAFGYSVMLKLLFKKSSNFLFIYELLRVLMRSLLGLISFAFNKNKRPIYFNRLKGLFLGIFEPIK